MKQFLRLFSMPACFISCAVSGQNLIPDPGFEKNKFVPMEFSSTHASYSWSMPSRGTSDLFCKCDRKTKYQTDKAYSFVDVPQNPMGYQHPNSGTCYGGLFALSHGDYREYLQTPLTQALQKNKTYLFTMHVSLADYSRAAIDQLGVCFPKGRSDYQSSDVITDLEPVYANIGEEIGIDTQDWHEISVTYTARGGESYVLLGSFEINKLWITKFEAPKEMRSRINQRGDRDAYYYIDDVSLVEIYPNGQPDMEEPPEPAEAVAEIAPGQLLVFKNVLFQTNEAVLLPASFPELDALARQLNDHQQFRISIFGHTDNSGSEAANKKLSEERARSVAGYLEGQGIDRSRISALGYGSSKPVAGNDTGEGKRQNRRVEFVLTQE